MKTQDLKTQDLSSVSPSLTCGSGVEEKRYIYVWCVCVSDTMMTGKAIRQRLKRFRRKLKRQRKEIIDFLFFEHLMNIGGKMEGFCNTRAVLFSKRKLLKLLWELQDSQQQYLYSEWRVKNKTEFGLLLVNLPERIELCSINRMDEVLDLVLLIEILVQRCQVSIVEKGMRYTSRWRWIILTVPFSTTRPSRDHWLMFVIGHLC